MTIQHKLVGDAMQMIVCQLGPDQQVFCEAGKFLWKTTNVTMETRLGKGAPGGASSGGTGGLLKRALATAGEVGKRALAGESLAFQWFRAAGDSGLVSFAGVLPGQMRVIELDGSRGWYAEKDAFVCAEGSVDFDIAFSGWKSGRRGGEGFILEKFTGVGTLVIAGAGNFIELNPARYGGKIQVDTGCVVAFEDTIRYGVERVGGLSMQTAMNAVFGGEGLNLATLEGDGQVILQSLTYDGMATALARREGHDDRTGITGGLFGGGND